MKAIGLNPIGLNRRGLYEIGEIKGSKERYYTQGLESIPWVSGYSAGVGAQSKNENGLYLLTDYGSSQANRTYVTSIAVDLTKIKTLYLDAENTGAVNSNNLLRFIASTSGGLATSATYDAKFQKTSAFSRRIESLNVSSLVGNYFLRIHSISTAAGYASELRIFRIWGEM